MMEWRIYLGHPSLTAMRHMSILEKQKLAAKCSEIEACEVCLKAKHAWSEFPVLNKRSSTLFEMVHEDIWGPYTEDNICGVKYMLTLVEGHSRMVWVYLSGK